MSTALATLQRDFLDAIEADAACAAGLEVYRRGVLANRVAALGAAYPVVLRLVGDAFFAEMARAYARAFPSRGGDLNAFGACLSRFAAGYPHAATLPYLADVARLEWAVHESLHAADGASLDLAALAAIDARHHAALRFLLVPSVRRVASAHAIHALWQANQPGRDGVPHEEGPQRVLVWRREGSARVEAIDDAQWRFLEALGDGETLAECQRRLGADDERLAPLLARYALEGVIDRFRGDPAG